MADWHTFRKLVCPPTQATFLPNKVRISSLVSEINTRLAMATNRNGRLAYISQACFPPPPSHRPPLPPYQAVCLPNKVQISSLVSEINSRLAMATNRNGRLAYISQVLLATFLPNKVQITSLVSEMNASKKYVHMDIAPTTERK